MEPRVVSETIVSPRSTSFQCSNCSKEEAEKRCSRCTAVRYCSKECQKEHWEHHKGYCNEIKKLLRKVVVEREPLRRYEDWFGSDPYDLFEDNVGHFWGLVEPRNYCRARHALSMRLHECGIKNNSKLALELCVEHLLDLVWLNRGDNLGVRSLIPGILCALGETQEAYDFLKWWQVCDPDGRYDWGNLELPYCNLKDEDIFEDLSILCFHKYTDAFSFVSLFLIKYKVMLQLEKEKFSYEAFLLGTHSRIGEVSPVRKISGVSVVLQNIKRLIAPGTNKKIKILKQHLVELAKRIDEGNKFVIPGLLNSADLLAHPQPQYTSPGTQNEAHSVTICETDHWQSTPGIHKYLKNLYVGLHGKEKAEKNIAELPKEKAMLSVDGSNVYCLDQATIM